MFKLERRSGRWDESDDVEEYEMSSGELMVEENRGGLFDRETEVEEEGIDPRWTFRDGPGVEFEWDDETPAVDVVGCDSDIVDESPAL